MSLIPSPNPFSNEPQIEYRLTVSRDGEGIDAHFRPVLPEVPLGYGRRLQAVTPFNPVPGSPFADIEQARLACKHHRELQRKRPGSVLETFVL